VISTTHRHYDIMRRLIAANAALEGEPDAEITPLCAAAGNGPTAVKLLLDAKADVNGLDADGQAPLMHAARAESWMTAAELLEAGANPDGCVDVEDQDREHATPLELAAHRGCLDLVRQLLRFKASMEIRAGKHNVPLMLAAATGHENVSWVLMLHGAVADSVDEAGYTPLMHAAAAGHTATITQLLEGALYSAISADDPSLSWWDCAFQMKDCLVTLRSTGRLPARWRPEE